ncbi:MAG: NAD(P)/FAD-dependent oxidoreductase [Bacteroidia bacterium]
MYDVIIIGGGAAGFFCAAQIIEQKPNAKVLILERAKDVLQKVKISGGGRCNVTHACWEPNELIKNYPRGSKELLGPFNKFCTGDMVYWLEQNNVETKIEEDGRMFPTSDSSQTIIDCLLGATLKKGVELQCNQNVQSLKKVGDTWSVKTKSSLFKAKTIMIAAGSSKFVWNMLKDLGHQIIEPVPSLFTFNTKDFRLKSLAGLSVAKAELSINGSKLQSQGPLLVTHWGLSGPAILRLSAWGAIELAKLNYKFTLKVNFSGLEEFQVREQIENLKKGGEKKAISNYPQFQIPKRLWQSIIPSQLESKAYKSLDHKEMDQLLDSICQAKFKINGKSTFKDEFVTAGGIELSEVDFRTMESKVLLGLHFGGEVLNIDAITGGFNFQAAWTTGWLAAKGIIGMLDNQ